MPAAEPPHVILLASPAGAGHVLPMAEFARRLAEHHGFTATIITYSNMSLPPLRDLPATVTTAALPAVPLDDLPADARIETCMLAVVSRALPHLRALLASIVRERGGNVVAFLADMFCAQALPLASGLGVPPYIVFLTNLMFLALLLRLPELDAATAAGCEYRDLPEPVRLPGCVPLRGADLLATIQDRSNPAYGLMVQMARDHLLADGFVVNTFDAVEHETLNAFRELSGEGVCPPVYAVGPFLRPWSAAAAEHGCLRWLDDQPDGSVLYVCYGSGGTLSVEQTAELAAGLEACGQRFLWVVHFPSDKDGSATYFGTEGQGDDPLSFLPEGFIERTKGVGLCVPLWAPQVEVLRHRAVGAFLSHCGWNSTLEAVDAGVPMVAWPLFAEQRMNAVMLEEKVGMALQPAGLSKNGRVVPREDVVAVVRELMVGEKGKAARVMAKAMQKAAAEALKPEGLSSKALAAVVSKWKAAHRGAKNEACPP